MQFELTKEFLSKLEDAIQKNDDKLLMEQVSNLHPADIAEILDELTLAEARSLYHLFDDEMAADVLEETRKEVISHLEGVDEASDIIDLLHYEEGTAGALMAKELVSVKQEWTVETCIEEIRRQAEDIEFIYIVYVVDDQNILKGIVDLKTLIVSSAETRVVDVVDTEVISARTTTESEEAVQIMEKYDLVVLPVIDEQGQLVGRITIDDVVDVMIEEAEKDYQLASGISENVESSDNVLTLTRARLPWLLIGMLGGLLGAEVIGLFDLKENIEMAFFIPLIAAMGGNVGVQSSAIIVQGLASNSLGMDTYFTRMVKELGVALLNGLVCSAIILAASLLLGYGMTLSITVSVSLLAVIIFAALFGTFVPLTLEKYKIDPALATGPFVTTVNDIFGLLLYFAIGRIFFI